MKIIIGGGTGFIGQALSKRLQEAGHKVSILSRKKTPNTISWDEPLPEADAIVNLAGANIFKASKEQILSSRLEPTRYISKNPPPIFINASATGIYSTDLATENTPPGNTFLANVCKEWEAAAQDATIVRIGIVLGSEGGALKKMLPIFKLGLGGKLGPGTQGMPWIHIDDLTALFQHLIEHPTSGIFNAVAPETATNKEFTKALGKALHRPTIFPVPSPILKLALGDKASFLLNSVRVIPERLIKERFPFQYPTLESALKNLIG